MFAASFYRANQPKTFSNQAKLPRLPVPDLETSLEGYLKSLVPVLEQKYGASSLSNEIEKRKLFARDLIAEGGLGRTLQERLKDLDHVSPNNWLNDTLWLGLAYHTWRAPLLVNSNWWLLFASDPKDTPPPSYKPSPTSSQSVPDPSPKQDRPSGSQGGGDEWLASHGKLDDLISFEEAVRGGDATAWQIRRAAWMAHRFAQFRAKLQREEILPDSSKAGPYCMSQYAKVYNLSRIPLPNSDAFSVTAENALHLTLLIDDFIYSVDVFAPPASEGAVPEPLSAAEIEKRFAAAAEDVRNRRAKGEEAPKIGLLTADERDTWVKNRELLLLLSPSNRDTLNSISASLLSLSLDPYTLPSIPNDDPLRHPAIDAQVRNCATGIDGGRNRWFDKALSVIVETNGRGGIMGEHSPVDALIPSVIVDYVLAEPVDESAFASSASEASGKGWQRLDWVVDDAMKQEIEECQKRNRKLIEDSDASQLWWSEYGAEWIKKDAKLSPDAYLQQALQLAWYRDQGYATATYETASTRMMLHGRTDVIRTLSSESRDFVKGMLDTNVDDTKRYDLLSRACTAHNTLTRTSSAGHGFDRHLMGLKVHLRPGETHALFDDETYAKSQEWKLSTSGLNAGGRFMGTGFGAAWPDGYGINYLAGPHLVKFGIESKTSCAVTSTARFKHHIAQSLRDMRRVGEMAAKEETARFLSKVKQSFHPATEVDTSGSKPILPLQLRPSPASCEIHIEARMTTYALSRLSPFSLSLFGPSPPSLPKVPTLGELQKHAEILAEAVPTYTASPKPISRPSSSPGVSQRATQGPWFLGGTPPPSYSQEDPFDRAAKEEVDGRRLKKKIGWRRLGDGEGPRMQGGRGYATSEYDGIPGWELMRGDVKQPGIDDVEGEGREKSGWWRWLTCWA